MNIEGKKRIWEEYQKEIADDHYFYVRSCIRQNFFPASEATFWKIITDYIKKDIFESAHHSSCTGIGYHTDVVPFDTTQAVVARQFSLMTENGYKNLTSSCITSFGLYSEILETWKHAPEQLARARENLYKATKREFEVPENVAHTSDLIYKYRDEIAALAKYKLINKKTGEPIRGVEHIGCHYAKMFPSKGIGGAEHPYVLAGMIESWGGEVIDYPERRACCGFGFRQYFIQANRGYSVACSKRKFESMEAYKPEFILTNCPGCPYFLDRWQYAIAEMEGKTYGENGYGIPVLTYEELAGLVLGFDPWDLGLQMHQVSVEPLLDKMGVQYDSSKKFAGINNKNIGKPCMPDKLKIVQ